MADAKSPKDAQVEGAKAKAEVIHSPSLKEQAEKVEGKGPGSWEKPGSDLQEPGKVEGIVLTKDDLNKETKKSRKPRYIAGKLEPIYVDEERFEELKKKLEEMKKRYDNQESNIPASDDEYWSTKREFERVAQGR